MPTRSLCPGNFVDIDAELDHIDITLLPVSETIVVNDRTSLEVDWAAAEAVIRRSADAETVTIMNHLTTIPTNYGNGPHDIPLLTYGTSLLTRKTVGKNLFWFEDTAGNKSRALHNHSFSRALLLARFGRSPFISRFGEYEMCGQCDEVWEDNDNLEEQGMRYGEAATSGPPHAFGFTTLCSIYDLKVSQIRANEDLPSSLLNICANCYF